MKTAEERRAYWRGIVEGHKGSGLTVSEYCGQEGVSAFSFYHWRKRLARIPGISFALVRREDATSGEGAIELTLVGGERLRIPPGASAETLRMTLGALREARR